MCTYAIEVTQTGLVSRRTFARLGGRLVAYKRHTSFASFVLAPRLIKCITPGPVSASESLSVNSLIMSHKERERYRKWPDSCRENVVKEHVRDRSISVFQIARCELGGVESDG